MSTKTGVTLKRRDGRTPDGTLRRMGVPVMDLRTGDAATVLGPKGWTAERLIGPYRPTSWTTFLI